jgi:mRNA-degrading endonuclease RelE of RelBE toxin-antitoxin system
MSEDFRVRDALISIQDDPPFHFDVESALAEFGYSSESDVPLVHSRMHLETSASDDDEPGPKIGQPPSLRAPPWYIGFSKDFRNDIDAMDGRMRNRVFEAILSISGTTLEGRNDTVKKLKGDFYRDCWRIRIGDHRLVFRAVVAEAQLTVLCFAARGDVYGEQA